MEISKFLNEEIFGSNFKLISLMAALATAILFILPNQTSWAALIQCPTDTMICNGTEGNDIIIGTIENGVIHGLDGDDYIRGLSYAINYIYGDDGDDILIGGIKNDGLYGGNGNDRYDGTGGDDTIYEEHLKEGSFVNNDDIISGGFGIDLIWSGEGSDRIEGGPNADSIQPNPPWRDFSPDVVNCGSGGIGGDGVSFLFSGDGDTAINCESVFNPDE